MRGSVHTWSKRTRVLAPSVTVSVTTISVCLGSVQTLSESISAPARTTALLISTRYLAEAAAVPARHSLTVPKSGTSWVALRLVPISVCDWRYMSMAQQLNMIFCRIKRLTECA